MSTVNRIRGYLSEDGLLPKPKGAFSDSEALELLMIYRANPGHLPCPQCARKHGPDTIEVLAFIVPVIDSAGNATVTEPEGEYCAALYCHACKRAVGILANLESN